MLNALTSLAGTPRARRSENLDDVAGGRIALDPLDASREQPGVPETDRPLAAGTQYDARELHSRLLGDVVLTRMGGRLVCQTFFGGDRFRRMVEDAHCVPRCRILAKLAAKPI